MIVEIDVKIRHGEKEETAHMGVDSEGLDKENRKGIIESFSERIIEKVEELLKIMNK